MDREDFHLFTLAEVYLLLWNHCF